MCKCTHTVRTCICVCCRRMCNKQTHQRRFRPVPPVGGTAVPPVGGTAISLEPKWLLAGRGDRRLLGRCLSLARRSRGPSPLLVRCHRQTVCVCYLRFPRLEDNGIYRHSATHAIDCPKMLANRKLEICPVPKARIGEFEGLTQAYSEG